MEPHTSISIVSRQRPGWVQKPLENAWKPPETSTFRTSFFHTSTFHTSTFHTSTFHTATFHTSTFHTSTFHISTLHTSTLHTSTFHTPRSRLPRAPPRRGELRSAVCASRVQRRAGAGPAPVGAAQRSARFDFGPLLGAGGAGAEYLHGGFSYQNHDEIFHINGFYIKLFI